MLIVGGLSAQMQQLRSSRLENFAVIRDELHGKIAVQFIISPVRMMQMAPQFSWDRRKAAGNIEKHSVTFEEAASVFRDPTAVIFHDELHSEEEYRELIIGHSERNRLLIVSFTERDDIIRIISARTAKKRERDSYEQYRKR